MPKSILCWKGQQEPFRRGSGKHWGKPLVKWKAQNLKGTGSTSPYWNSKSTADLDCWSYIALKRDEVVKKPQLPPLCNCSELDQSAVTEETPEGEEHPPADSENKWVPPLSVPLPCFRGAVALPLTSAIYSWFIYWLFGQTQIIHSAAEWVSLKTSCLEIVLNHSLVSCRLFQIYLLIIIPTTLWVLGLQLQIPNPKASVLRLGIETWSRNARERQLFKLNFPRQPWRLCDWAVGERLYLSFQSYLDLCPSHLDTVTEGTRGWMNERVTERPKEPYWYRVGVKIQLFMVA